MLFCSQAASRCGTKQHTPIARDHCATVRPCTIYSTRGRPRPTAAADGAGKSTCTSLLCTPVICASGGASARNGTFASHYSEPPKPVATTSADRVQCMKPHATPRHATPRHATPRHADERTGLETRWRTCRRHRGGEAYEGSYGARLVQCVQCGMVHRHELQALEHAHQQLDLRAARPAHTRAHVPRMRPGGCPIAQDTIRR